MGDDDLFYKKAKLVTALEEGAEPERKTLEPWQVDFCLVNDRLDYVLVGPPWGDRWLAVFLTEAAREYKIEPDPDFQSYDHVLSTDGRRVRIDKTIRIDFEKKIMFTNLANEEAELFYKVLNHFLTTIGNRAAAQPPTGQA